MHYRVHYRMGMPSHYPANQSDTRLKFLDDSNKIYFLIFVAQFHGVSGGYILEP
jgi:hypothetical protein